MAESKPAAKRSKRRLRAPTQTVRQRAEQVQSNAAKPPKRRRARTQASKLGNLFRPLGKLFQRQPFRFIGKIIFPNYFRTAWQELRQVEWPNRKQSRQLTTAVLAFAIVFGAAIALVDYGLDKVFRTILLK